jgi:hypothetical protein
MPSSPRMIVRSSRVVQPPVSGVPVAGATAIHVRCFRECVAVIRLTGRVKGVNVDTQVHGLSGTNPISNFLYYPVRADFVNFSSLDNLEATVAIVLVVRGAGQRRADAGVYVGVIGEETFLRCVEEVGAVVDAGLLTR